MHPESSSSYQQIEEKILAWARSKADIEAVLVVGSRARQDHPPDDLSDLDLIVFTRQIPAVRTSPDWLEGFGEVWLSLPGFTGRGDPEWQVVYAGGQTDPAQRALGGASRAGLRDETRPAADDRMAWPPGGSAPA